MALDSFDFQYFGFNDSPPWFGLRHLIVVSLLSDILKRLYI